MKSLNKHQQPPRPLLQAVEKALQEIFLTEPPRYADKVIEQILKNPRWGSRDRKFIAENTYEVVRWWRLILHCLEIYKYNTIKYNETLTQALHKWLELQGQQKQPDQGTLLSHLFPHLPLAIRESFPDWLCDLFTEQLEQLNSQYKPKSIDSVIHALNIQAPVFLRANTLKISRENLQKALASDDQKENLQIQTEHPSFAGLDKLPHFFQTLMNCPPEALLLKRRQNVFQSSLFKQGMFEVQDISSQMVGHFLNPQPGERIIDACAGAGGKSLHLAALMGNKGKIISLDIHAQKLTRLQERARRAGAQLIETRSIDSSKTIKRLAASADRLLLDVPCSGTGVFRRNPDAKWKLKSEDIPRLIQTQNDILKTYVSMLRPKGTLVYSTCSVLPCENEVRIQEFLKTKEGSQFELLETLQIWPDQNYPGDGFYMAKLQLRS